MQVDLSANFFDLFALPVTFAVDAEQLALHYRELQKATHPDKFASGSNAEKRWSMQAAAYINEAHGTLANPLARASYLLKLQGVDLDVETDTRMPGEFLMQQMELREQLEAIPGSADPFAAVDKVRAELSATVVTTQGQFEACLSSNDLTGARGLARQWQFLDKLLREASDIEARLDDA